jgi:DNA-binding transcriptional LysR family regulator
LKPSALEHAAWILHPHIPATCQAVDRICLRVGLSRPANILESSSLAMTLSLLSNSDAITILPEGAVRQPLRTGQLIHLPIAVGDCSLEFGILACRRVPPGRAALEFSELLRLRHDSSERIDEVEQSCLT